MGDLISSFASPGIAAAVLGIGVGLAAFLALGLHSRRRLELRSAMGWLNALKWRDFARVLTSLLAQRGLQPHEAERKPGDDGFDLLMVRGTTRYVVQCKHGAAYRVTPAAVRDLAKVMNIQGADGAILLTTGRSEPAAKALAEGERIEVIDQEPLWTQLRPLLPDADRKRIGERAEAARNRRLGAVCALALLAGAGTFVLLSALQPAATRSTAERAPPTANPAPTRVPATPPPDPDRPATAQPLVMPQARPDAEAAAPAAATAPAPIESPEEAPTSEAQIEASRLAAQALAEIAQLSEAQLEARRTEAAALAARVPGIERADWQTRSTLVLGINGPWLEDPEAVTEAVCRELVRFEELRYTRLQLESARENPDYRVRWRQCR